jgi:hypothetical protein
VSPSLLDALGCPYCGGVLFKESYYVRCEREHRFRSSLQRGRPSGAPSTPGDQVNGAPAPRALQLRVIWHPDRREVGRTFAFPLSEEGA